MTDKPRMRKLTGLTTNQMLKAPVGATYVWVNSNLCYPKKLARHLGRQDLEIVRSSWLTFRNCNGRRVSALILDHGLETDEEMQEVIEYLKIRSRLNLYGEGDPR